MKIVARILALFVFPFVWVRRALRSMPPVILLVDHTGERVAWGGTTYVRERKTWYDERRLCEAGPRTSERLGDAVSAHRASMKVGADVPALVAKDPLHEAGGRIYLTPAERAVLSARVSPPDVEIIHWNSSRDGSLVRVRGVLYFRAWLGDHFEAEDGTRLDKGDVAAVVEARASQETKAAFARIRGAS